MYKTIWHTPEEKPEVVDVRYETGKQRWETEEKIKYIKPVLMFGTWGSGDPCVIHVYEMWKFEMFNQCFNRDFAEENSCIEKWCYVDDLLALEDKLDRAVDFISGVARTTPYYEGDHYFIEDAQNALKDIGVENA